MASGSLSLPSSSAFAVSVATFSFSNNTWTGLGNEGDLPGPATAVEVNNGNSSSIFAAGRYLLCLHFITVLTRWIDPMTGPLLSCHFGMVLLGVH